MFSRITVEEAFKIMCASPLIMIGFGFVTGKDSRRADTTQGGATAHP